MVEHESADAMTRTEQEASTRAERLKQIERLLGFPHHFASIPAREETGWLLAELADAERERDFFKKKARDWNTEADRYLAQRDEWQIRAEAAERERDAAVHWIGVVRDELTRDGWPAGNRDVALANLRDLLRGWRAMLRKAEAYDALELGRA